jgi:hypothetical protein
MAETLGRDALIRQLALHLQSLAVAGIEWLPQGPPLAAGDSRNFQADYSDVR